MYFYVYNLQGDVTHILDDDANIVGTYTYDAWGKITNLSSLTSIAQTNPFRYRGYYYDTESGLYYLNSRYYNPDWGRFLNADDVSLLGVDGDFSSYNLFVYCGNNPVVRRDTCGTAWETALDIISLGSSVADVAINPTNLWSWAGLVGDLIDVAVPFVGGIGESVDVVKIVVGIVENTDNVVDAAKATKKIVSKSTGSYEILYKSGKNYIGKGPFNRAITSAIEHTKPNDLNGMMGDTVKSITWKSAPTTKQAFIDEYLWQKARGGVLSANKTLNTYNRIWSPGRKFFK